MIAIPVSIPAMFVTNGKSKVVKDAAIAYGFATEVDRRSVARPEILHSHAFVTV
jgi:hypothetical protein